MSPVLLLRVIRSDDTAGGASFLNYKEGSGGGLSAARTSTYRKKGNS